MGKSGEKKAEGAYKATDDKSKHKNKPRFNATTFEATDDERARHSKWHDHFRQLCEFKEQIGHSLVPVKYSANPKLGRWVLNQRNYYRLYREGTPSPMTEDRIRELKSLGFDWGTSQTDLESIWSLRLEQLYEYKLQFGHWAPASCHNNTLTTPNSGGGFRISAAPIGCTTQESPVARQRSAFESSRMLGLTGGQCHAFGAFDSNNCAITRQSSVTASYRNSTLATPSPLVIL